MAPYVETFVAVMPTEGIFCKDFVANGWGGGAGNIFFGVKLLSISIAGRIVLSHVHVSTLRRTWSTQKLMSSGGGMTRLE